MIWFRGHGRKEDKEGERGQANGQSDLGCPVGRRELVHTYQGSMTWPFNKGQGHDIDEDKQKIF